MCVTFAKDTMLEKIGYGCFCGSGLDKITFPKTLKKIGESALLACENLEEIYVEDGCEASLYQAGVPDFATVVLVPETMAGGMRLMDLRKLKEIVIPEGT